MRILLVTGYASIATAVEAIKLGADDYLPKPATVPMILRASARTTARPTMAKWKCPTR
jgi:ActR/RegA family two-component response regulator